MAGPQKRVKRKSEVRNRQSSQTVGTSRKRKIHKKITKTEACSQNKRRRYNLRHSNSVILVGETPCCQTPEQQAKYSKLSLNSALFIKGSQRPKRKQSHISVITISSDDEETSEERTSEWVNSLGRSCQSNVEADQMNIDENMEVEEQPIQPLNSSTPYNLRSTVQNQPDAEEKPEEFSTYTPSSTEAPTENKQDKLNELQEPDKIDSNSSNGNQRSPTGSRSDQGKQEETFQLVISVPDSSTDSPPFMQNQPDDLNEAEKSDSTPSLESSVADRVGNCNEADESDSTPSLESSVADRVGNCNEADESGHTDSHQGYSGTPFSFTSGVGSTSSGFFSTTPIERNNNLENVIKVEGLPLKKSFFYFGSSNDSEIGLQRTSYLRTFINNHMNIQRSGGISSTTSNEGQGETNHFDWSNINSIRNTNNQIEQNSINSEDPGVDQERNSNSESSQQDQ